MKRGPDHLLILNNLLIKLPNAEQALAIIPGEQLSIRFKNSDGTTDLRKQALIKRILDDLQVKYETRGEGSSTFLEIRSDSFENAISSAESVKEPKMKKQNVNIRDFEDFLDRLKKAKNREINPNLNALITKSNLDQIYDYFLIGDDERELKRLDDPEEQFMHVSLLCRLALLASDDGYRFSKKDTKLPRTISILRTPHGEYQLILETKSKYADNTKTILPDTSGSLKRGKPAWRIDKEETEIFTLVAQSTNLAEIQKVPCEIDHAREFGAKFVKKAMVGKIYSRQNADQTMYKISIYAPKAQDLFCFLDENKLDEVQSNKLIMDILKQIKKIHDANWVHRDLKLENILLRWNGGNLQVSLWDFETLTKSTSIDDMPQASSCYQSPEIAALYHDPKECCHDYYFSEEGKKSLGNQHYSKNPDFYEEYAEDKFVDKADDMWAAGIVIFTIRYDNIPTLNELDLIDSDPLLKGLLDPDPRYRINIDTAIAIHQDRMMKKSQQKSEKLLKYKFEHIHIQPSSDVEVNEDRSAQKKSPAKCK